MKKGLSVKIPRFLLLCWIAVIFHPLTLAAVSQQNLNNVKIDLQLDQKTIAESLKAIEQKTGLAFCFYEEIINKQTAKVTLNIKQASVSEALTEVLRNTDLTYKETPNCIVIEKKAKPESTPNPTSGFGSIKGRVVEAETSEPLPAANVVLVGTQLGVVTDVEGYYHFTKVPAGKYTLEVSYIGFQKTNIDVQVTASKTATYDVKMSGDATALSEVTVSAIRKQRSSVPHMTEKVLVQEIKALQVVASGISSEQISKSADRNAAQAVQRVSGVSIVDDKFVIVRGLNQRYNLTYLNDVVAPSTEVYSRSFALDLIPSRIIDRILVLKSSGSEHQADATGGVVKIYTKDAQTVKHFDIEVQGAIRSGSTFKKILTHKGGKWDWLGFDDGVRKLPSSVPGYGVLSQATISQAEYTQSFSPVLWHDQATAIPNAQITANYYNAFPIGGKMLSMLTSLSYKNENQHSDVYQQQGLLYSFNANDKITYDNRNTETAQINLLQNFSYKLGENSHIRFNNFILQQGIKTSTSRLSHPHSDSYYTLNKDNILSYAQRFLYAGNLGGDHSLVNGKHKLKWNIGYNYTRQETPDQRVIRYSTTVSDRAVGDNNLQWIARVRQGDAEKADVIGVQLGSISRTWMRNDDDLYNFSADYTFKWNKWLSLHAGTFHVFKRRKFYRRIFTVNEGDLTGNIGVDAGTLPGHSGAFIDPAIIAFNELDIRNVWSTAYLREDGSGIKVFDRTSGSDAYVGTEQNNSGYVSFSLTPFNGKLEIYGGMRAEYNRQRIGAAIPSKPSPPYAPNINEPILVDYSKLDWFPSVNISWRPDERFVVRGGYSKTINRPEFRETSPFEEINYDDNQIIQGNPNLIPSLAQNYNLRIEFYPKNANGESFSAGVFYKKLDNPIERINSSIRHNSDGKRINTTISYENADNASIKGIELEARKSFDFIPTSFFRNLSLIANLSLIESDVLKETENKTTNEKTTTIKRALQGQAPYIINAGLYYDNAGIGSKISLIYNIVGTRIYAASPANSGADIPGVGAEYRGSLMELTRHGLDLSFTQRVGKGLQLKFAVQNLLDKPVEMAEDYNQNYTYEKEFMRETVGTDGETMMVKDGDNIASRFKPGRYFSLSLSYSF